MGVAFYAFILFTSNPFERMMVPPFNGQDLNPLLQDPGLAFHPPFLYLGYVGLSMAFSFAVAALLEGKVDAAWGRWVRPWTLAAWLFLTIGIALGSWWAYYELGWGGFWFWDPVENASFMPWLIAAALLHSAIVVEKREGVEGLDDPAGDPGLRLLAGGARSSFSSGVLTSVHAFANDPERGVYILAILGIFTGGALLLYALRAPAMQAKGVFECRVQGIGAGGQQPPPGSLLLRGLHRDHLAAHRRDGLRPEALGRGRPSSNAAFTPFVITIAVILPLGSLLTWEAGQVADDTPAPSRSPGWRWP